MLTYKPGDLILFGQPFVFALYSEERANHCDQCFTKLCSSYTPCEHCDYVRYCNKSCKTLNRSFHQRECKVLKQRPLRNLTRLLARVICLQHPSAQDQFDVVEGRPRRFDDLLHHLDQVRFDSFAMHLFNQVFAELELIFSNDELDIDLVLKFYGRILVNSFAIQDCFLRPIGRAIYLGASIFDHSCSPDASFTFIGTTIFIKAVKVIQVESLRDIYISYLNELDSKEDRINTLQSQYYFQCQCTRCRFQSSMECNQHVTTALLRSNCDLIDKLSLDYFAILLELPHRIKLNAICMEPPSDLSDHILNVHLKDNPDAQQLFRHLSVNLNEQLGPLIRPLGPLSARLLEFKSFLLQDVRLSLAVIDYFRSYYGQFHPRLAVKLLLTAYQLRNRPHEHLLRLKLLEEAQQIATKIVPSLQDLRHQPTNRARQLNKLKETFLGQIECELFAAKSQMQSDRLQMQSGPNGRSSRSIVASTLRNAARSHSSMPASLTIRASRPVSLIRHLQPGGLSSRLMVASRWTTAIYY